jgi:hypothetical protein
VLHANRGQMKRVLGQQEHALKAVLRIRIHRIHMFLGLPDPDPLVRGMDLDPDPSIIMQKWLCKILIPTIL